LLKFATIFIFIIVFFTSCSTRGSGVYRAKPVIDDDFSSYDVPITSKKKYSHPTMRPYTVRGVTYYPTPVNIGDTFRGRASWYGPDFHGKLTSNGEKYNMYDMTAAHKTLPMNTILEVTNRRNGKKTIVRINDRGPFVASRIIDLSKMAARELDMIKTGTAPVTLKVVGFAGKKKRTRKKRVKKSRKKVKQHSNYYLQIASFSNIGGAIAVQEKYDGADGYRTIIKDIENRDERVFKVLLGKFKTKDEALKYKYSSGFRNAFIIKEGQLW